MAVTSGQLGKLGLAIVESLGENRPGEKDAIKKAWEATGGRLWKKWADPQIWFAVFDDIPQDNVLAQNLIRAAGKFYDHPGDTGLEEALRQILQAQALFPPETIIKAVRDYIETLSEELFLADAHFRVALKARPEATSREIVDRLTPLLKKPAEPAEKKIPPETIDKVSKGRDKFKAYEAWVPFKSATEEILKIQQQAEILSSAPKPAQVESADAEPMSLAAVSPSMAGPLLAETRESQLLPAQTGPEPADLRPNKEERPTPIKLRGKKSPKTPKTPGKPKGRRTKEARQVPGFIGRESELLRLADWLKNDQQLVVIGQDSSLKGLHGVGKSCLAQEYADLHRTEYKGGVFWIHCADPDLIPHKIAAFAKGPPGRPLNVRLQQVLAEWQGETARLLIFDDCADASLLEPWLPSQGANHVLITSQADEWGADKPIHLLPLTLFHRTESLAVLKVFCGDRETEADLDLLAAELDDSPLGIHLAGSFLASGSSTGKVINVILALQEAKLQEHYWLRNLKNLPGDTDLQVGSLLKVILDQFNLENEADRFARKLFHWMSACAPDEPIPQDFLLHLTGEKATAEYILKAGLKRLVDLGLLQANRSGQIKIHPLIAMFAQAIEQDQAEVKQMQQGLLAAAVKINQARLPETMLPLLPHLKHLCDHAFEKKTDETAARLANELGYSFEIASDYPAAQAYFEKALTINHKMLGQVHPETAICLTNLGHLLTKTGDYKNARIYYQEALDIRRKLLGEDHPDVARSLNNLGYLLQMMGKYKEALPCYERALSIRRKKLGKKDSETAVSLTNLGSLSQSMRDLPGARSYIEQALSVRRTTLGEEHPETARSWNDLGYYFMAAGEYRAARVSLEKALAIRKKVLGEEHPDTARSLHKLGELFLAKEDCKEARPYFERALTIEKKMLGEDTLETATTFNRLGATLLALGDYSGARANLEKALAIREKIQGHANPEVASNLDQLSHLSQAQGETTQAQAYENQATAIRSTIEMEKQPRFTGLGKRGRIAVATLFALAVLIFGWNLLVPGPTPITLTWNHSIPGSIPLLQPLKLFARHTATGTNTATLTLTPTPTLTLTFTPSFTRIVVVPPIRFPTATLTLFNPTMTSTRTYIYWTSTATPTPAPPPGATSTPTSIPTAYIPPTETPTPTEIPTAYNPFPSETSTP